MDLLIRAASSLVAAATLAACTILAPQPIDTRYYVLTPLAADGAAAAADGSGGRVVGLGPIVFPRYLERTELVHRAKANEIAISDDDRWASPLATEFRDVLAQDLWALGATDRVVFFPWYAGTTPFHRVVEVDVLRFERDVDGQVRLLARWRVKNGRDGTLLRAGESDVSEPADPTAEAYVAALSRAVAALARDLAAAMAVAPDGPAPRRPRR